MNESHRLISTNSLIYLFCYEEIIGNLNLFLVKQKDSSQSTGQNKGRTHRMADLNAASVYCDIS